MSVKKRVIIIGGGYAGCQLAKLLDANMEVLLVEPKDFFFHVPAAIRAAVVPSLLEDLFIPYNDFLENGKQVKGWVETITSSGVTLKDGSSLTADAVVVATGSSYALPFKASGDNLDELRAANKQFAVQVKNATTVAIVGAGAVGIELAGEIMSVYPSKDVHLVAAEPSLLPMYKPSLATKLRKQLIKLGIKLHLGSAVENLVSTTEPYSGELKLADGKTIAADLIVPVVGSWPNNDLLKKIQDVAFDHQGRAINDTWFRPSQSHPFLFVVGDAGASVDGMTIVSLTRQTPWLANIIFDLCDGKETESLSPYEPWPVAPMLIPLGPKTGLSILPLPKGDGSMVVGSLITTY